MFQNMEIILGNIYAPNDDQPSFFAKIIEGIKMLDYRLRILRGDFNMALNVDIDKEVQQIKKEILEKYCYNKWKKQAYVIYGSRIILNVSGVHGVEVSV